MAVPRWVAGPLTLGVRVRVRVPPWGALAPRPPPRTSRSPARRRVPPTPAHRPTMPSPMPMPMPRDTPPACGQIILAVDRYPPY